MKNNIIVICLIALLLSGGYLAFSSGCRQESMQITPLPRGHRRGATAEAGVVPVYPLTFSFNRKYKLTSVKVVSADDLKTNKHPYAVWHLVPDPEARPTPVKAIMYGQNVPGLKPKIPGAFPDALEPGAQYVIFIEAGGIKSQTNFIARENTRIAAPSR